MTRFEKILTTLVIAWIIQAISMPVIQSAMRTGILDGSAKGKDHIADVMALNTILITASGFLSKAVFGYWLYIASSKENEKKWIWCLLGIFGGIYGVLIFYPYLILKEIRSKKEPNQQSLQTTIMAATEAAAQPPSQP